MILLDTSVLLWVLRNDPRLGRRARARIRRAEAVYASAVSLAEIAIKSMIGRLSAPADLRDRLSDAGFTELPLNGGHADAIRDFSQLLRHDPLDRLLVAQAQAEGFELLTSDRALLKLGRDFILDATQ